MATTSVTALAQSNLRSERLLQLLRAKGVLTEAEVTELRTDSVELERRLIALLQRKGVLTIAEASELHGDPPIRWDGSPGNVQLVSLQGVSPLDHF